VARWSTNCSNQLVQFVRDENSIDIPGVQRIRNVTYRDSPWVEVESLKLGRSYYFNEETRKHTFKVPKELEGVDVLSEDMRIANVKFSEPPTQWPENLNLMDVITNSYPVTGGLLKRRVFSYDVVFDPHIDEKENKERENVIMGVTFSQKMSNRRTLEEIFEQYVFDNHEFYAVPSKGNPSKRVTVSNLHPAYSVTFTLKEMVFLNDPSIPYSRQEQILNLFLRDQMTVARFKMIRNEWYKETNDLRSQCQTVHGQKTGNLAVLTGYKGSMQATVGNEEVCFQVDTCSRLLWEATLHEQIEKIRKESSSEEEFKSKVERKFMGKFFLLSYSRRSKKIASFDWSQTENSSMGHDNVMAYKDYYKSKYNVRSDTRERCVVKAPGGECYLPQHMNLTVVSDECADIYDKAMDFTNMPIHQRLKKLDGFVRELNQARNGYKKGGSRQNSTGGRNSNGGPPGGPPDRDLMLGFDIAPRGRVVSAVALTVPTINYKTRGGITPCAANQIKREWRNTCGYVGDTIAIKNWAVVYDAKHYGGQRVDSEFMNTFQHYCRKRNFDLRRGDPWTTPKFRPVDLANFANYRRYITPTDRFLLVLLPDGIGGSEIKVKFTRAVDGNGTACHIQFAKIDNIGAATKMFGVWENMAIKAGNILYHVDPKLPPGSPIVPDEIWCCGLDVSHNGPSKPSVAVLSLCMSPMQGSLRDVLHNYKLNPPRQELLSYHSMWALMLMSLHRSFEKIGKDHRRLPKVIWVFRDGVADGQLREMVSKEFNGVKRAINAFSAKYGLKKEKKWKPRVQYIVVQKHINARFAQLMPGGRVQVPQVEAVVVHNYITSKRVWDFIGWFNTSGKNRPLRYVVVKDEAELAKSAPVDLFQFCYALCYAYSYGIPFPFGNPNQPAPIKFAKHFAENVSQGILPSDINTASMATSRASVSRPAACTLVTASAE